MAVKKSMDISTPNAIAKAKESLLLYLNNCEGKKATVSEIEDALQLSQVNTFKIIKELEQEENILKSDKWYLPTPKEDYIDWNGNLKHAIKLYNMKIPTLFIGDKGSGKTRCTEEVAKEVGTTLDTINLSLRCRESHILGRLDIKESKKGVQEVTWLKGPLPRSMEAGNILYLDELSAGEPDVLLRLDEALDDRRQLSYEGITINAHPNWWCTASINPLTTPGTKELPPQLISRFTARLYFAYPPNDIEMRIIRIHVPTLKTRNGMSKVLQYFSKLRGNDALPYSPSLRESILFARLLMEGYDIPETLEIVAFNPLHHWNSDVYDIAREHAQSMELI